MTWTGGEGIGGGDIGVDAATGGLAEGRVTPIPVDILEFEDTLFNDNSAVVMPEVPGLDPTAANAPFTGVKAIGMAFLFAGLYPERGLLVTGHTAAQGDIPESFRISRERAAGILYLIQGNVGGWSTTYAGRHLVRDYKQILKHLNDYAAAWKHGNWACDPGDIDNNFTADTEHAFTNFAQHFNSDIAEGAEEISALPFTLGELVLEAPDNRLSPQYWRAFYYVYELMVCDFLGKTRAELTALRNNLHWVNDAVKMVGCGHSFPVPGGERGNDKIRSTTDNRVEVLIYQASGAGSTALAGCPTMGTNALHDLAHVCPMWYERHFERNYVGPGDRYAVVYHLKFRYYDRIKKGFQNIAGKVNLKAYKRNRAACSASQEIPCINQYQNGIHTVRVRFGVANPNPDFTNKFFYFAFEAPRAADGVTPIVRMIHTSAPDQTPTMVNRPDDWAGKTFAEKYQYYDLPMKWSSHNWHTRHESNHANDCAYHEHIKDKRQLKPFGGNVTSQSEPLAFSLDDIVLFDNATGHDQNIRDADQAGTAKDLCAGDANPGSRVKVFIADTTNHTLKLWQKPNDDNTSMKTPPLAAPASPSRGSNITTAKQERIRFERNLVSGLAPGAKAVHFRDNFYVVSDQRTTDQPANWMDLAHKPVLGARKAIRDDADRHIKWERHVFNDPLGFTGDFELHYLHQLYLEEAHPVSFLIIYMSMNFMLSSKGAQARTTWAADPANPDMGDVANFVNTGVYNANGRWNQKRFFYDETTAGDSTLRVRPCYFFDERETFEIPLASAPNNIDYKESSQVNNLIDHAQVTAARNAAFGGPAKWLTCITPEADGSWAWSIRSSSRRFSVMSLRKSTYTHPTGGFAYSTGGYNEDGDAYGCFVFAHELGHATSLQDEYIKTENINIGGDSRSHNAFSHHLIQYTMDPNNEACIMFHNGVPRLRHCWYHLHFLNTTIQAIPTADTHILKNKTFALRFVCGSKDHTFTRNVNWTPSGASPAAGSASIKSDLREAVIKEGQARLPNFVTVSAAPDLSTLGAGLQAKVSFDATSNVLTWIDAGVMSDADRDALRGLFTADANKNKVNALQQKTRSLRRLCLALYDTGQDESSEGENSSKGCFTGNQNGYRYHGVLVVRVMVGAATGAPAMSAVNVHAKLGSIHAAWVNLNQKYRLTGGPSELGNVYVHFMPGFAAQASAGSEWNYAMSFVTGYSATLTGTLDTATLSPGLQAAVTYNSGTHALAYSGVMTSAHHTELRAAVASGDRARVDQLYQKTNLTSADGRVDVAQTITGAQLKDHFLNMNSGDNELTALKFLATWINDKLSASYTLESVPAGP